MTTEQNWNVVLACDRLVGAVRRLQNEPSFEAAKNVIDICHEIQSNAFSVAILKSRKFTGPAVQLTNNRFKWVKEIKEEHDCPLI